MMMSFNTLTVIIFFAIFCFSNCLKIATPLSRTTKTINPRYKLLPLKVGDYASEITNAVGSEIYGPIFKAGLFLIVSGIFSAGIVSTIISKSDTWNDLGDEFERGKQSQLTSMSSNSAVNNKDSERSDYNKVLSSDNEDKDVNLLDI